jgi:hypothetical protein
MVREAGLIHVNHLAPPQIPDERRMTSPVRKKGILFHNRWHGDVAVGDKERRLYVEIGCSSFRESEGAIDRANYDTTQAIFVDIAPNGEYSRNRR